MKFDIAGNLVLTFYYHPIRSGILNFPFNIRASLLIWQINGKN